MNLPEIFSVLIVLYLRIQLPFIHVGNIWWCDNIGPLTTPGKEIMCIETSTDRDLISLTQMEGYLIVRGSIIHGGIECFNALPS